MNKANQDIRTEAKNANVKLWQIASELGINDVTFTKKMRFELSKAEKLKILHIICNLQEKEAKANAKHS